MNEANPVWADRLLASSRSTRWHVNATRWQVAREVAATTYLLDALGRERFLPPIGGWSVDYSVVAAVLDAVRQLSGPVTMVELGSGAGTPWFATIAQQSGGHLVSVEHNPEFVARTTALLNHYDLADSCTVALAELTNDSEATQWYDLPPVLAAIGDRIVDVLIIDGPPNDSGPQPRRPALFALQHLLADGALVVLDDVVREEERKTFTDWQQAFGDRIRVVPLLDRAEIFRFDATPTAPEASSRAPCGSLDHATTTDSQE